MSRIDILLKDTNASEHEKMFKVINHQGNTNQDHNEISLQLLGWLLLKRQWITIEDEDRKQKEPCALLGEGCKRYSHYRMDVTLKKKKEERNINRITARLGEIPPLSIYLKENETNILEEIFRLLMFIG